MNKDTVIVRAVKFKSKYLFEVLNIPQNHIVELNGRSGEFFQCYDRNVEIKLYKITNDNKKIFKKDLPYELKTYPTN